jgi:hypothetical protein
MQILPNIIQQSLGITEFNTRKIDSTNSIKFLAIIVASSLTWKECTVYMNSKII